MPALYRAATLLLFPSVKEGFGLVVLEAMASGVPVVTARTEPFISYLGKDDVLWCDPHDNRIDRVGDDIRPRARCARRSAWAGASRVRPRMVWGKVAARHVDVYTTMLEPAHA